MARRVRAHAGGTVTWPSAVGAARRGWAGLLAETKGLQNPRALIAPRARVNIPISNYVYNSGGAPAAAAVQGDSGAARWGWRRRTEVKR